MFKVHCKKVKGEETFQIKNLRLQHTCGFQDINTKLNAKYLAERYLEQWRSDPGWNLKAFKCQILRDTGCAASYSKCWYARGKALQAIKGLADDEYARVWDYVAMVKKYNLGSSAFVKVGQIERPPTVFERMYICLDACKKGFANGCRPVIGVDGCHLKGPYPGQLLTAVGKDGNGNIFPIAWAVVEVENTESWCWFLDLLIRDMGSQRWTFMSDRQKVNIFSSFLKHICRVFLHLHLALIFLCFYDRVYWRHYIG